MLKLFLRNKILNYYLAKISKIKKLRMVHMNLSCKAVLKDVFNIMETKNDMYGFVEFKE